jgi:EAL domain-containing protein (putative c-di-GMP-specific phosphodiesterase class I)
VGTARSLPAGAALARCRLSVVVAVNLSNVQFAHADLLRYADEALAASGLAPAYLDLEITGKTIMGGDAATLALVNTLRARGVQLTIDDFGTGFSNLSSLRRFPLSKLKIDRSFVDDIVSEPDAAAMIPAIIALARSLKLKVIAEGGRRPNSCTSCSGMAATNTRGFMRAARRRPPLRRPRAPDKIVRARRSDEDITPVRRGAATPPWRFCQALYTPASMRPCPSS